jgi:hypothetical protein
MIKSLNQIIEKLEQLPEAEQEKFAQEMLTKLENLTALSQEVREKNLSDALLLPEEEQENPLVKMRPSGLCEGEFIVPDDFDEPLPEDILQTFEGS